MCALSVNRVLTFPVAQMVEHGASNAKIHGFNSQGKQELIKCKTVTWMQCKSLWIKASAKCINVKCKCNRADRDQFWLKEPEYCHKKLFNWRALTYVCFWCRFVFLWLLMKQWVVFLRIPKHKINQHISLRTTHTFHTEVCNADSAALFCHSDKLQSCNNSL